MKFARYLHDTQTPEWKKAYIDYRGLKKLISAIRRSRQGTGSPTVPNTPLCESPPSAGGSNELPIVNKFQSTTDGHKDHSSSFHDSSALSTQRSSIDKTPVIPLAPAPPIRHLSYSLHQPEPAVTRQARHVPSPNPWDSDESGDNNAPILRPRASLLKMLSKGAVSTGLQRRSSRSSNRSTAQSDEVVLHYLYSRLSPKEQKFFAALDAELDKVESFYLDREAEMRSRTNLIKDQLVELSDHRKVFIASFPPDRRSWSVKLASSIPIPGIHLFKSDPLTSSTPKTLVREPRESFRPNTSIANGEPTKGKASADGRGTDERQPVLDPEDYLHAKKKLKAAILEHYRGLETLNNYRILNLTGFRKALKKFEKVTKLPVQQVYANEKLDPSAFAAGSLLAAQIKEIEHLFAARFTGGNMKKALEMLRAREKDRTYHSSTFRTGVMLGLAMPPLIAGIFESFQPETRVDIPAWDGLLLVYATFFVPVLFALLVGLNLLVWSRSRINYVFIFELDIRTKLDYRQYFELPAYLLCTLCYAFYLSFARLGTAHVASTTWPLLWLAFAAFTIIDPIPIHYKPSRYWLNKSVWILFLSGTRRVEFTDFWMGDQFCSLIFTLSNLYVVSCAYARGFDSTWQQCSAGSRNWGVPFVLASVPLIVRLVQSVKRYYDSRLNTHLINAGKYGSGIVSYLFYFYWRHVGGRGTSFVWYCLFTALYAIYACSWDFIMDWSVLQPHSKYPLLRRELVYTDYIPLYYFSIVSNILLRLAWVINIPQRGPSMALRSFIAAMLEMLRRWQWNFYRLENEHLGNMDQYRVTREVPLPYAFDGITHDHEDDYDDGDEDGRSRRSWIPLHRPSFRKSKMSLGPHMDDD